MDLKIDAKNENKLLDRVEVDFSLDYAGEKSPSRQDLRKALSEKLSVDSNLVILDKFEQSAGKASGKGYAKVYKTKETMEKIERAHIKERNFPKKSEKKEA